MRIFHINKLYGVMWTYCIISSIDTLYIDFSNYEIIVMKYPQV